MPAELKVTETARVKIELVDSLPGGMTVMPLQREGLLVFQVDRSHMTEQLAQDLTRSAQLQVDTGYWAQHWPESTPQPHLAATRPCAESGARLPGTSR